MKAVFAKANSSLGGIMSKSRIGKKKKEKEERKERRVEGRKEGKRREERKEKKKGNKHDLKDLI